MRRFASVSRLDCGFLSAPAQAGAAANRTSGGPEFGDVDAKRDLRVLDCPLAVRRGDRRAAAPHLHPAAAAAAAVSDRHSTRRRLSLSAFPVPFSTTDVSLCIGDTKFPHVVPYASFSSCGLTLQLQLRFDFDSTAIRPPFDSTPVRLKFDRATTILRYGLPFSGLLHCDLTK